METTIKSKPPLLPVLEIEFKDDHGRFHYLNEDDSVCIENGKILLHKAHTHQVTMLMQSMDKTIKEVHCIEFSSRQLIKIIL